METPIIKLDMKVSWDDSSQNMENHKWQPNHQPDNEAWFLQKKSKKHKLPPHPQSPQPLHPPMQPTSGMVAAPSPKPGLPIRTPALPRSLEFEHQKPRISEDFTMKHLDFTMKHLDFTMKHLDFTMKHLDFTMKRVDLTCQDAGFSSKTRRFWAWHMVISRWTSVKHETWQI